MSIPKNLKTLREAAGLTQAEAAARVGLTRQAISSYESGRTRPDVDMLMKLAEVYGVDLDAVLYGQSKEQARLRRVRAFAVGLGCVLLGLVLVRSLLMMIMSVFFPLAAGIGDPSVLTVRNGLISAGTYVQIILYAAARLGSIALGILLLTVKRLPPLRERLLWFGGLASGSVLGALFFAALDPVYGAIDYLMLPLWVSPPLVLLFLFSLALGWWKTPKGGSAHKE